MKNPAVTGFFSCYRYLLGGHMEIITSRQNPQILHAVRLQDRKHRQREKLFCFDGVKLCVEALMSNIEIERIFLRASSADRVIERIERELPSAKFSELSSLILLEDAVFEKISIEKSPEGVICIAKYIDKCHKIVTINNIEESTVYPVEKNERIMLLESVRDPGNLGTIIRSASAFGIDRLIISEDCADLYNPKTVRASMGTLFHQRIDRVTDMPSSIRALQKQGRCIYAAALDSTALRLGTAKLSTTDGIVIGNEGHGLSDDTIAACTGCLFIPMAEGTESLNAAMAATVCMWEMFR
jgi:TrmH family RNA methyltransferase